MTRLEIAGNVESEHGRTCVCSVDETNRRKQKKTYMKLICGNLGFEVADFPVLRNHRPMWNQLIHGDGDGDGDGDDVTQEKGVGVSQSNSHVAVVDMNCAMQTGHFRRSQVSIVNLKTLFRQSLDPRNIVIFSMNNLTDSVIFMSNLSCTSHIRLANLGADTLRQLFLF